MQKAYYLSGNFYTSFIRPTLFGKPQTLLRYL